MVCGWQNHVKLHIRKNFVDVKNLQKCQVYMAVVYLALIIIISLQQKCILTFRTVSNI